MTSRILIVEDNQQVDHHVGACLKEAGFVVLTTADHTAARPLVRSEHPDLVLLNMQLPGRDGLAVTRWLRADPGLTRIPIVMLAARAEDADKIMGLEAGADDYLAKPYSPRELLARVHAILRRAAVSATVPQMLQIGGLRLDLDHQLLSVQGQAVDLTPTEFTLLQILMKNPDHAFTRAELIDKALGYTYGGLERTLDSHIKNLRKKIEADPVRPRYLETVFGVGYRLRNQAP